MTGGNFSIAYIIGRIRVDFVGDSIGALIATALGAFLATLIAGEIFLSVRSEELHQSMAAAKDDPIRMFLFGVVPFILGGAIVIMIPSPAMAFLYYVVAYAVWSFGAVVAYLAIVAEFIQNGYNETKSLFMAAVLNGLITLTGIGAIIAFSIGAVGVGALWKIHSTSNR